ncbi:MAG: hypothetical protein V1901_04405 [Patescibacteria group bacterium]
MDKYDWDLIKTGAIIVSFTIFCIIILTFGVGYDTYKYYVNMSRSNLIKITIGNKLNEEKEIYSGKSAFVEIESGGSITTVTIYKKLFPFPIRDRVYADKTIKIEPIK